jgi:hypothetical protein
VAISTYDELQTAVTNWLARSDLSARVPEFISLAEGEMSRQLWSQENEVRATTTTTSGDAYVTLPDDIRYIRAAKLQTSPVTLLRPVALDYGRWYYASAGNNKPHVYAVYGTTMEVFPTPDAAYTVELTYIKGIPALSDSNTSNTILSKYPDAYLYGALYNANEYLMDEQRAEYYYRRFARAIKQISDDYERLRYPGGLQMRSDYVGWSHGR